MTGSKRQESIELLEKYTLVADHMLDCIWMYDLQRKCFLYISPSVERLRGLPVAAVMQETLDGAFLPDSAKKIRTLIENRMKRYRSGDRSSGVLSCADDFQIYCAGGTVKDVEITTKLMETEQNGEVVLIGISRDITERKQLEMRLQNEIDQKNISIRKLCESEKKLARLTRELTDRNEILKVIAVTDELTGLHNRYYFDVKVEEEIEKAECENSLLSMVIFDLDHFKKINDTWGHDIGDKVLAKTARVVEEMVAPPDMLMRWGGEEFAVIMPGSGVERALAVAEGMRQAIIGKPYLNAINMTASFGVAEKLPQESFQHWFNRADYALYRAKSDGRNCVVGCRKTEIMPMALMHLEWKKDWECHNKTIDDQHKKLLDLSNGLLDLSLAAVNSTEQRAQIDRLLDHIVTHFMAEENILKQSGYPDVHAHAQKHKELLLEIGLLKEKFLIGEVKSSSLFSFLVDEVVMNHMLTDDVRFFSYVKEE